MRIVVQILILLVLAVVAGFITGYANSEELCAEDDTHWESATCHNSEPKK